VGSFEHDDKLSVSIKSGGISWPSKRLVLPKKDSVPWSHFFGYFEKEMYGQAHSWASCGVDSAVHLSGQFFIAIL
jgi:hypothetical protein